MHYMFFINKKLQPRVICTKKNQKIDVFLCIFVLTVKAFPLFFLCFEFFLCFFFIFSVFPIDKSLKINYHIYCIDVKVGFWGGKV